MQREVQLQALKAAARVAFSIGTLSLVSCGGVTSDPSPPPSGTSGPGGETPSGTATGTADPNGGKTGSNPTRDPAPTATTTTPPAPTTPSTPAKSCEKVIADAFPTEGQYPGVKQNVSSEVKSCCEKVLLESQGTAPHRWDCCANVDQEKDQKIAMACTPWGPPVPPAMSRGIRRVHAVA